MNSLEPRTVTPKPFFFMNSLKRTYSRVHARLNTQRKIITVMYGLWKKGEAYRRELFLGSAEIVALYD